MMDITLGIEWVISVGVSVAVSGFIYGYKYCKNLKDPILETKEFDCEHVHNEWVESMTYSGYPVILQGFKKAKADFKDDRLCFVACRHFNGSDFSCSITHAPCLIVNLLPNNQTSGQTQKQPLIQRLVLKYL
jgi:hypothetical protein